MPGAAASYGFKIYGGAAKTTGGIFSGAFVMDGIAYIQKATIKADGSTGFGVWSKGYNTNILFEPIDDEGKIQNEWIKVSGSSTGMAIENGSTYPEFTVKIYGGTFTGGTEGTANNNTNGIWYGNQKAKMTISGGTFTGETRSGLWLGVDPGSNIKLSGGTYYGAKNQVKMYYNWGFPNCDNDTEYNAIDGNSNIAYSNILSAQYSALGYTDYDGTVTGVIDKAEEYTVKQSLSESEINEKGYVKIQYRLIWYDTDLVYSRIEVKPDETV